MRFPLERIGPVTDWRSGETWAGERIRRHALGVAAMLRARGAAPGRTVVIHHGGDARFFADLFGVWRAGACAVCLSPSTTVAELGTIVDFVEPAAVLVKSAGKAPEGLGVPVLASGEAGGDGDDAIDAEDLGGGLDDDALILFTSGTTGTPKGVLHTFRSILARVTLNQAHIPASALTRTLCVLPTHFGHGLIGNCLTPLLAGHDVVIAPAANLEVTAGLGDIVDAYGITFMSSVPTMWKKVIKSAAPKGDTLGRVHVGSAPLSAELWQAIADWTGTNDVVNMYGITETANWLGGASLADHPAEDGLIGRMWGGTAAVLTSTGEVRPDGEGEILVQSRSLMKAYYKRADETAEVLRGGWFHTGDIGRIDGAGVMRLTGREKNEINRGGMKIHPEDINLLLERHPAVREACAFPIPDEVEGQTVGVAVSLANGADTDARRLRRWCAERISREKVPVKWFVLDEIPKTDHGKLNQAAVAAHCLKARPGP